MTSFAIMGLGVQELVIILVIVLLLFGGSRLAGLGKSSGRALKEFKEETRGLRDNKDDAVPPASGAPTQSYPPQQVTNGQAVPAPEPYPTNGHQAATNAYPPVPQQNLTDPSAADVRKDV